MHPTTRQRKPKRTKIDQVLERILEARARCAPESEQALNLDFTRRMRANLKRARTILQKTLDFELMCTRPDISVEGVAEANRMLSELAEGEAYWLSVMRRYAN